MNQTDANIKLLSRTMFRLLPIQTLMAAVGAVNGFVSSYFASNFVSVDAVGAIGIFGPLSMLVGAVSTMLVGGAVILCGRYIGKNRQEKSQNVFALSLMLSALIAFLFTLLFVVLGLFDLTGFLARDASVRPLFNRYLIGQSIGVFPSVLGNQLFAFLSLENKTGRSIIASAAFAVANVVLTYLFVCVFGWGEFGLALASSLGMWVYFGVQAQYFLSGKSHFRLFSGKLDWKETLDIIRIGCPGAISSGHQTIRGFVVNTLILAFVGSAGISAFAASDNLLKLFWTIPSGMMAVSRMMLSISIGEEDRESLRDTMRVMFRRFVPLMCCVSALLILFAVPLTRIYYQDATEPVYKMTVWALRILPLCMPLSVICMHFICYGQTSGKTWFVHILSLVDGVLSVTLFTALLIRSLGIISVYVANVLNGIMTTLVILIYSMLMKKRFPRDIDDLMVIPDDFGVPESERMDLSVRDMNGVIEISKRVQDFCLGKGIDRRRAYLAGLALEEMAGNVVDHGFSKDSKKHSIDIRVVHKNDDVILRIKDDCVPFDPGERLSIANNEDPAANIGIRMIFKIARDIQHRVILGMNVLTIRI
ncbi:MAG: ATP-binding protein [Clostridia bacterium]|nr:ATP-binding protein [Clostridia bacterium]